MAFPSRDESSSWRQVEAPRAACSLGSIAFPLNTIFDRGGHRLGESTRFDQDRYGILAGTRRS